MPSRRQIPKLAVALLMTNGAVFLFKSLQNVLTADQAFDTEQVLTAHVVLSGGDYDAVESTRTRFWDSFVERVEAQLHDARLLAAGVLARDRVKKEIKAGSWIEVQVDRRADADRGPGQGNPAQRGDRGAGSGG